MNFRADDVMTIYEHPSLESKVVYSIPEGGDYLAFDYFEEQGRNDIGWIVVAYNTKPLSTTPEYFVAGFARCELTDRIKSIFFPPAPISYE